LDGQIIAAKRLNSEDSERLGVDKLFNLGRFDHFDNSQE
jgi:hypothetical protein